MWRNERETIVIINGEVGGRGGQVHSAWNWVELRDWRQRSYLRENGWALLGSLESRQCLFTWRERHPMLEYRLHDKRDQQSTQPVTLSLGHNNLFLSTLTLIQLLKATKNKKKNKKKDTYAKNESQNQTIRTSHGKKEQKKRGEISPPPLMSCSWV